MSTYQHRAVTGFQLLQLAISLVILVLLGNVYLDNLDLKRAIMSNDKKGADLYGHQDSQLSADKTESIDDILKLERPSPEQIFKYFRWTNSTSCSVSADFGLHLYKYVGYAYPDGNKAVCVDPGVTPSFNNCLVYSFGVRDEWSFEETMQDYGCDVFAFDPSMNVSDHQHSELVHFYRLGLGGENYEKHPKTSWKMRTLSSIYEMLLPKHGPRIIDYLKIDIEWSEWTTLPQIFESGMLSKVKQLSMDVHLNEEASVDTFVRQYRMLRTIEKDYGFCRFSSRPNLWSGNHEYFAALGRHENIAFEMAWYNSHFLSRVPQSESQLK